MRLKLTMLVMLLTSPVLAQLPTYNLNALGSSGTVATAASTTNSSFSILSASGTSGNQSPATIAGFTINPSTGATAIPGAFQVGSGTGGTVTTAALISGGTKFTATGCTSITATVGGAAAGKFTIGAVSCTVVITINGATGLTAPNGWSCRANDETTAAGNTQLYFSTNSTTTATLSVPSTAVASDVIDFNCMAF